MLTCASTTLIMSTFSLFLCLFIHSIFLRPKCDMYKYVLPINRATVAGVVVVWTTTGGCCRENAGKSYKWTEQWHCRHNKWRSRQNFGGAKNFCPNFPKLARKIFGPLFVRIFSHEDRIGRHFFKSKHVGRHIFQNKICRGLFLNQKTLGAFLRVFSKSLPRFSGILRRFSHNLPRFRRIFTKSKLLGVSVHPASYTTDCRDYRNHASYIHNHASYTEQTHFVSEL